MLETPTWGKFYKEERFLVFEPGIQYLALVYLCLGGGSLAVLYGLFRFDPYYFFVGGMVAAAGFWANLSLVRIRFDLRSRLFRRRQGPGLIPRLWAGSIDELDALVVLAENSTNLGHVRYHLVLHWKSHRAPLMVLETDPRVIQHDHGGQQPLVLVRALKYSKALGLPLYDNTQFMSPCPVPIF
jgi:hypothetical protein